MASLSHVEPEKRKPPLRRKAKPKKNQAWYDQWGAKQTHCQCCGIDRELAAHHRYPGTSTHHIAKAGRVHTATNVIHLCARCHDLAENLDTPVWLPDGTKYYYPKLTFAHCHWLKRERSPEEYDAAVLTRLRMGRLPEAERVPHIFEAEWQARVEGDFEFAEELLKMTDWPGTLRDLLMARMQPK